MSISFLILNSRSFFAPGRCDSSRSSVLQVVTLYSGMGSLPRVPRPLLGHAWPELATKHPASAFKAQKRECIALLFMSYWFRVQDIHPSVDA